ncbi:MAG: 4-hydroxy-tetrahydrodipicolinate synthase, partial [Nannocystaceae bacterium]
MFRGALTALITPFDGPRVDFEALDRLVSRQLDAGIHGLVPCGTTGEAATLSRDEHLKVVERVVQRVAGRVPVIAGAGSNDTRDAIELAKACEAKGADGTLQVTPYYNRPPQEGLVAHFEAIANACERPIILYNVPSRTGCDMQSATVAKLSAHPRIVGIKEATGDLGRASEIRRACGDSFTLLSGDDFTILPFLSVGGHGVISVVSNVVPKLIVDLVDAPAN